MSAHLDEMFMTESKANLSELSKIPAKEFEVHFREWLERDDVARSLQAKLRADLILNFNKTALGKQLLSQSASSLGGSTHRLTLSPLILALNTLVAEFLYAVNCHFSLSVFSTEVPFRNTLPDFESSRCFRFTEREIIEIIEALTGNFKCEPSLKYKVAQNYANSGTTSLLLLIVKNLMQRVCLTPDVGQSQQQSCSSPRQRKAKKTATTATAMTPPHTPRHSATPISPPPQSSQKDDKTSHHELKTKIYNTNFRYLNKYLIILSKKVKEMSEQFESLRELKYPSSATPKTRLRVHKSSNTRKFDHLNRSLELITKNLRQMNETKRRSKHVGAIVSAIDTLSEQFEKCAAKFEKLSRGFMAEKGGSHRAVSSSPLEMRMAEKQTGADVAPEKSYSEWVREMRNSENGRKFLDRVESALSKSLDKQRTHLEEETALKLKHQKQLLKVHYKQKLIEKLSQNTSGNVTIESHKFQDKIDQQLKKFEDNHIKLLQKIGEAERDAIDIARKETNAGKVLDVIREKVLDPELMRPHLKVDESTEQEHKTCVLPVADKTVPIFSLKPVVAQSHFAKLTETSSQTDQVPSARHKDMLVSTQQIQNIVKEISEHDRNVVDIIAGAKQRIQELENVGNRLDQNFRDYLERQKIQKEVAHEVAERMCNNYASERKNLRAQIKKMKASTAQSTAVELTTPPMDKVAVALRDDVELKISSSDSGSSPPRNPIQEAKEKFFNGNFQSKRPIHLQELRNGAYLQSHYYNEEFMAENSANGGYPSASKDEQQHLQVPAPERVGGAVQPTGDMHLSLSMSSSASVNSATTKSTSSSSSSHLGRSSSQVTTTSTTNSSDTPANKYIVHSKAEETPKSLIDESRMQRRRHQLFGSGISSSQVPMAYQNNSHCSATNTRGHNKANVNGTAEMPVELEHRHSSNNIECTRMSDNCDMTKGITIYSVTQIQDGAGNSVQQIKENKRPHGNHDGGMISTQTSSLALQQSMMKMQRIFSHRPSKLTDIIVDADNGNDEHENEAGEKQKHAGTSATHEACNNGVNDVEAAAASGGFTGASTSAATMAGGGAGSGVSTTTITSATVSTSQHGHGKHLAEGRSQCVDGRGAVVRDVTAESKGVAIDGAASASAVVVAAVDIVDAVDSYVALRRNTMRNNANNGGHQHTMAAQPQQQQAGVKAPAMWPVPNMPSINDLVLHISDDDDDEDEDADEYDKHGNAKFHDVCEEVAGDELDCIPELAEDDSVCEEGIVTFEDVEELTEDDEDGDGIQLKRTEAQTSFVERPESMIFNATDAEMEMALERLLAGNGEMEIGEVVMEEHTLERGEIRRNPDVTSSTTGSSADMKMSVAARSGSGSGSDFWK